MTPSKLNASPVQLDANGCPRDLIGGRHHFNDLKQKELEHGRSDTPMDGMRYACTGQEQAPQAPWP